MRAHGRTGAWGRRVSAVRSIGGPGAVAIMLAASLAAGCSPQVTPSPSVAVTATPSPSASPSPAHSDTLRIGWPPGDPLPYRESVWGLSPNLISLAGLVYSGLYRWDARYGPVPDLADGPCVPQNDGTVIRCHLVEATFQDGTPLTADDVRYSYQLFGSQALTSTETVWGAWCGTCLLKEVRVHDPRTVDFVVSSTDPRFVAEALPTVAILPQHAVEAAYAAFVARSKSLKATDLAKLADAIDGDLGHDPPVCTAHLDAATTLLAELGASLYRGDFPDPAGTFDPCAYIGTASGRIRQAAATLDAVALAASKSTAAHQVDARALAFAFLSIAKQPIGTGPYRLVGQDASGVRLEAWPGYHGGLAATRFIDFVPAKGDGSDLVAGTVDVFQGSNLGSAFRATAASHGVQVVSAPGGVYTALAFNVQPGHLFSDVALRKALQLCIDLPLDIAAVAGGTGTPAYGPILPGSWGDDPDLPRPARDTTAARALIQGAGWELGPDGTYAKNGLRLKAQIPVRGISADRIHMADLIEQQARDCGMDLRGLPLGDPEYFTALTYPFDLPGTKTQWDVFLLAWTYLVDPDIMLAAFSSTEAASAKNPLGNNVTGFTDPVVERLYAAGRATYDQAKRASIYWQLQEELAAQLPYVFLWAATSDDAVRNAVATVDGPLDLTVPNWAWQPERLVVTTSRP